MLQQLLPAGKGDSTACAAFNADNGCVAPCHFREVFWFEPQLEKV